MEMDDGDDLYEPEEPKVEQNEEKKAHVASKAEDLESGEEEDEGAAMDEDDDDSVCTIQFASSEGGADYRTGY